MSFPNEDLKMALSLTQTAPISNGITAEYVPGTGWMYVTEQGRFGSFDTEFGAITAGGSAAHKSHAP